MQICCQQLCSSGAATGGRGKVGCRKRTAGGGRRSCANVGNDATARGGGRRIAHLRTCTRRCEQPGVQPQCSIGSSAVEPRRTRALGSAAGYERTETHPGNKRKHTWVAASAVRVYILARSLTGQPPRVTSVADSKVTYTMPRRTAFKTGLYEDPMQRFVVS